jgi:hypothetical protein
MKVCGAMGWGMLLALLLKYLDSKAGLLNIRNGYEFPWMELTIVAFTVYISYEL